VRKPRTFEQTDEAAVAKRGRYPDDVYFSQIDALHADARSLIVGAGACFAVCLYIAYVAQSYGLLAITMLMPLVVSLRLVWMRGYWRTREEIKTRAAMRVWELRYVVGSTIHVACFGFGALVVFLVTDDGFCRFAWTTCSLMYMQGIAGRNFATGPLVIIQLLAGFVPMALAMLVAGSFYGALIPALLPGIVATYLISTRLRTLLLDAVLSSRENAQIAARFDAALNNMPLGLWMFDTDGRLVVANGAGPRILGTIPRSSNSTIHDVFAGSLQTGRFDPNDIESLIHAFDARGNGDESVILPIETKDGKYLSFAIHALADGGSIVMLEDTTARRAAESVIHDLARFDPLTRLMNRAFFERNIKESLERIAWRNESFALLFIDLDHFKAVNDSLGHQQGDALLRAVSDRLRGLVRETDFVARFGGDEFVIQQTRVRNPQQTQRLAERITVALGAPFEIDGHVINVGASVGMALAPRDGLDVDTLMKNADLALYNAKSAGRGTWRFFERAMDLELHARRELEADIRAALANETFEVHFQPLYSARTRTVTGAEALMRMTHPERGPISPVKFIAVMEEQGLIADVGRRVLERACRECARWPAHLKIAVNISPHQFARGDLEQIVRNALALSGLDPSRLELEITESAFLAQSPMTMKTLEHLRAIGVQIALDDFGTGYSSLSYLHQFPIDKLKIDRSFLRSIDSDARSLLLLRNVAQMSHNLGLKVVVEGVETEAQMALVVAEGTIDEVQGFLFSKAVPAETMRALAAQDMRLAEAS
jgi:diguanylate cyclase (GGDEF)-like protein